MLRSQVLLAFQHQPVCGAQPPQQTSPGFTQAFLETEQPFVVPYVELNVSHPGVYAKGDKSLDHAEPPGNQINRSPRSSTGTMYSQSKKWESPQYKHGGELRQLNEARKRICPNSPIWPLNFDKKKHDFEWKAGERRRKLAWERYKTRVAEERLRLRGLGLPPPTATRAPFGGKTYDINRSNVLSRKTIFCPQWEKGKEDIAPWPSKQEMNYEGGDRIFTDRLHRRFPGAPRVAANDTVTWQQRALIPQYALEEYYWPVPSADDVFFRTHRIGLLEFDDQEGKEILGTELMRMLDPQDQW